LLVEELYVTKLAVDPGLREKGRAMRETALGEKKGGVKLTSLVWTLGDLKLLKP